MPSRVCSVPLDWTIEDYLSHSCGDGSHVHISHAQVAIHKEKDIVRYLRETTSRKMKDVVQIQLLAVRDDRWAGRASITAATGGPMNPGLSFRVGEYLAKHVRKRESWAIVMYAHIKNRPVREFAEIAEEIA